MPCIGLNGNWKRAWCSRRDKRPLRPIAGKLLVEKTIGGVPQQIRRLTVSVYEHAVETAIGRGLLGRNDTGDPWNVLSALFAAMFEDHTIAWLNKRGYLRDERCRGEAIIAAINTLIARHR